ncbi:MobF family relaxase [Vibrio bathopelagicus]
MLSMNAINNLDYYSDLAAKDYYLSGGEPVGVWSGLGARLLGLQGQVNTDDYRKVFLGYAPNGKPLCESLGEKHRAGWDLTFSSPKSVSVLWARAQPKLRQQIQAAQLNAVHHALSFLEQHAAITRRGHAGWQKEQVIGLVASLFEHSTSRAQDPQLHTHCLVANVAPRGDGSWGTLESRYLFLWQKAAGAVYRATLASKLRGLGFSIEHPDGEAHFEVKGIPKSICEFFSKRAEAIEDALDALSVNSSATKVGDKIKLTTRKYKQKIDRSDLFREWASVLDGLGFKVEHLVGLREEYSEFVPSPLPLLTITEKVVEKQSVFRLQDLYATVAMEAQWQYTDQQSIEGAVQYLVKQKAVVYLGRDEANNELFSTPAMIALERKMSQRAGRLQSQGQYQLSEKAIIEAIDRQAIEQGFTLSEEQAEGVFNVCQSGIDILQGAAGAGKSSAMQAVRLAYEAAGFFVRGATVAKQAALQLEAETEIKSGTLAKLLDELERNRTSLASTVLVVDEAGQLATQDLLCLMTAVEEAEGKLILVGEQQQMDAITHSGSLRFLSQIQGCARIETIRRQSEPWAREAVRQLRTGDATSALMAHQKRGLIHFADNSQSTREQLVQHWQQFRQKNSDKHAMILAQRWRDVKQLNELVRQVYQAEGKVGQENIEVDCAISNKVMRFQFSRGERVRFTRNDYHRNFTNGEQGIIERIEQHDKDIRFTVRCNDGRKVIFNRSEYCNEKGRLYLAQAYASTVYGSQGTTVYGDVFVYYTTGMDRSASYVAGSRHKGSCHWYVNREEIDLLSGSLACDQELTDEQRMLTLARCMSSNKQKLLALEYLEKHEASEHQSFIEVRRGKWTEPERIR